MSLSGRELAKIIMKKGQQKIDEKDLVQETVGENKEKDKSGQYVIVFVHFYNAKGKVSRGEYWLRMLFMLNLLIKSLAVDPLTLLVIVSC